MYKTISYPKNLSGTSVAEKLRISVANDTDTDFSLWMKNIGSSDLRAILVKNYKELGIDAIKQGKPISNIALNTIQKHFATLTDNKQLALFSPDKEPSLGRHGTFSPNHIESIHRWYPYIEGFSSTFIESILNKWSPLAETIYDPFAGTGTTLTTSLLRGMSPYYSEVNPFMRLVIRSKTNNLKLVSRRKKALSKYLLGLIEFARNNEVSLSKAEELSDSAFVGKPYFRTRPLIELLSLKQAIEDYKSNSSLYPEYAKLILGAIAVKSSNMKRAADLRYRSEKERVKDDYCAYKQFEKKINQVISDIDPNFGQLNSTKLVSDSCLKVDAKFKEIIDVVITSPPYLNGTNYFRNTKLELWLANFIKTEKELKYYRREALAAGINGISKDGRRPKLFDFVEPTAKELDKVAYDKRIPELIRRYSSDTELWLNNCFLLMKEGARLIVDIGDSRFAGVHVKTDEIILTIAKEIGFKLLDIELVRSRTSKDGVKLKQVLLVFEKFPREETKNTNTKTDLLKKAKNFEGNLPYKVGEYAKRNWGAPLHSLCSYQGKLKPALAHFLVKEFSNKGDIILDPLSGAGTIPLECMLQGRQAISNDIQELGYILSLAKVSMANPKAVLKTLSKIISYIEKNKELVDVNAYNNFGFNGKIPEYFHPETLKELLAARSYLKENPCNDTDCAIVYSCLFHILHGNRPYALSRRSHPVTPFKPQGEFEYRALSTRLTSKVMRSLENTSDSELKLKGKAYLGSFDDLCISKKVDAIITSPPFAASTRFYSSNWMRLWMAGWEPDDFKELKKEFIETRQKESFTVYSDFFKKCDAWLKPKGHIILHLGKSKSIDMADEIEKLLPKNFSTVFRFNESVAKAQKFGISDQGATTDHQFLFINKD